MIGDNRNESMGVAEAKKGKVPFRTSGVQVHVLHIFDPFIFIPDKVTAH